MNHLYRRFNQLPYDLYVEGKSKILAKEYATYARNYGKNARVVPDLKMKGKWCVYVLGAKTLPPFKR